MEIRTRLVNYMKELGDKDLCVAFSGGVDSSVILRAACEAATANGKKVYAVTFETKLHPKADLPQAQKVAKEAGAIHHVIYVNELDNEEMLNNPVNRCYLCKKYLFQNLLTFAAEKGIDTIMEGNNADDLLIYRIMYEDAESLSQYLDVSGDLAERIINCRNEISGFTQAASLLKTKELTQTRIQRALLHSILQILEAPLSVPYSRVLGFRKESSPLLKEIKKNSTLPVLTKLADSDALLDETGKRLLSETTAASNLYEKLLCKKNGQKFIHEYQKQIVIL